MDQWHVQQVEPQTLIMENIIMEKIIMENNNYGKTGQSALAPWFYRKNQLIMEIMAFSKNYGEKKRFGSLPGYFEPLWGKT